ncbi:hypothetical protein WH265_16025 [Comamonas sp. MYb396]
MPNPDSDIHPLVQEHGVMLRHYAALQARCTAQVDALRAEVEALRAQVTQLRAQVIMRDSALIWEREDRLVHLSAIANRAAVTAVRRCVDPAATMEVAAVPPPPPDAYLQELGQHATNLVICQTGCISHGGYWRDHDQCKRLGSTCLLEDPQAFVPTETAKASHAWVMTAASVPAKELP